MPRLVVDKLKGTYVRPVGDQITTKSSPHEFNDNEAHDLGQRLGAG